MGTRPTLERSREGFGYLGEPVFQILCRRLAIHTDVIEGAHGLRAVVTQLADLQVLEPAGVLQLERLQGTSSSGIAEAG